MSKKFDFTEMLRNAEHFWHRETAVSRAQNRRFCCMPKTLRNLQANFWCPKNHGFLRILRIFQHTQETSFIITTNCLEQKKPKTKSEKMNYLYKTGTPLLIILFCMFYGSSCFEILDVIDFLFEKFIHAERIIFYHGCGMFAP